MNYVVYNGQKIPIYNTPLSSGEMLELREKHENFLIKDVRLGSVKYITNDIKLSRFRIDFGFRPMLYVTALVLAFYQYTQTKKKIKKINPFVWGGEMKDFIKQEVKPNGTKPIEL